MKKLLFGLALTFLICGCNSNTVPTDPTPTPTPTTDTTYNPNSTVPSGEYK
jgi:hypothetical protein